MARKLYYLKQKRNGIWAFAWASEKGKYRSCGTRDRGEAEKFVQLLLEGRAREQESVTLKEFTKDFFVWDKCSYLKYKISRNKKIRPQTARDRRSYLLNHILPVFGNRLLASITRTDIDNFLIELSLANATKNTVLFTFRAVMKEAVRQGYITENPAEKVEQFAVKGFTKKRDILNPHEIAMLFPEDEEQLLAVWGNHQRAALCYLMLTTGMRNGEARALQWKDFIFDDDLRFRQLKAEHDFEGGVVLIDRSSRSDNSIGATKNGESRVAPIILRAKDLLLKYRSLTPYSNDDDWVFTCDGKSPVWASVPLKAFRKAMENAGVNVGDRNLVVHSLRHTFVTLGRGQGLNEQLLRETVGHTSEKITDIYDHNDKQLKLIYSLFENRNSLESMFSSIGA